jgi:hypothetical protein
MSESSTPSGSIVAAAIAESEATDSLKRKIRFRNLLALDKLRLLKAAGPILSENQRWMGMAMLAASVTKIDEWIAPFPTSERHIEMLVSRLGDEGLEAVATGLMTEKVKEAIAFAAAQEAREAGVDPTTTAATT